MLKIEGLSASDIKRLYTEGKKIHGYTGYFEVPANKWEDAATHEEGFPVAPGLNKKIKDFCNVKISKDGKKALISVKWSNFEPHHNHLDAFLKKFGTDCLRDEINPIDYNIEVI